MKIQEMQIGNYFLRYIYASIIVTILIVEVILNYSFTGLSKEKIKSNYSHPYLQENFVTHGTKWWEGIDTVFNHSNDGFVVDTLNVTFRRDTLFYDNDNRLCATLSQTGRYHGYFDSLVYSFNEKNQVFDMTSYWSEGTITKKYQMNKPYYSYKKNFNRSYEYYEDGRVKSVTTFNYDAPNRKWRNEFIYQENETFPLIIKYQLPQSENFIDTIPLHTFFRNIQPNPWLRNIDMDEHGSFVYFEIVCDTLNEFKSTYGYRSERHHRKVHY